MPLTDKQKKAFIDWLNSHHVSQVCPACGAQGVGQIHDGVVGGLDVDLKHKRLAPSPVGFLVVTCRQCAHVRLFAASPILGKT